MQASDLLKGNPKGMSENDDSPFTTALTAQHRLTQTLTEAGFAPHEFPQMYADVDMLGLPQIHVGHISPDTADRLAEVIGCTHRSAA